MTLKKSIAITLIFCLIFVVHHGCTFPVRTKFHDASLGDTTISGGIEVKNSRATSLSVIKQ